MLSRRGFTLIELLVSIGLLGIVGFATIRVLMAMLNTGAAQVELASTQGNARVGLLGLPLELREIGFDTIPFPGGQAVSDLEAIAPNRITFRAMRGMGVTCGTPTTTEFRILKPTLGMRAPEVTDGFLLFLESDPNYAMDDQWVPMIVRGVDPNSSCGADSAIRLTLAAAPIVDPSGAVPMALSMHRIGGPIRWFERVEYGPVIDPTTNETWLGARSLSLGQTELTPVVGPLPDSTAFALTYYGSNGAGLNPATALPVQVRSIGLSLTTVSSGRISLAGTTRRARAQVALDTRIALRNALRP